MKGHPIVGLTQQQTQNSQRDSSTIQLLFVFSISLGTQMQFIHPHYDEAMANGH